VAIDTSIYSQLLRPPKSVADYDAEALQAQQNRLALQVGQTQLDDRTRAIADGNKLRQVVSGFGADQTSNYNALLTAGRLTEAQAYQKLNADIAKTKADASHVAAQTQETHAKAVNLKMTQVKDLFNTVQSPEQAAQLVKGMYSDPDLAEVFRHSGDTPEAAISRIPTDPKAFQQWKIQASLGADKLIEYTTPNANTVANNNTSIATNAATNATSRANTASNNAVQIRGQNMVDSRTREAANSGKIPTGYRANADGSLSFIPGGPADPAAGGGKPATEFQGKSAGFGARAEQADKIITGLAGKYSQQKINTKTSTEDVPLIGGTLGAVANRFLGENEQQAEQAQRDFINSILRQESGAAIGASEFDNAKKQYFPQPGDGAKVIAQKEANRKLAVQGLKQSAGKAAFSAPSAAAPNDVFSAADAILSGGKK
jgi:hypothetical protein